MSVTLRLTVLTPDGSIVESQAVTKVRVRLVDGKLLSVYPYHAPLIAETLEGEVVYVIEEEEKRLCLRSGIFFVSENCVTVLTGGKLEYEAPQMPTETEERRTEHFDRLAATLMSTLRAHPQHVPEESSVSDVEG